MSSEELSFLSEDFEVLDKLGRGGMGQVFKARQKSLDRLVAIKVLPKELCRNAEFIGRFKREARLAGKFYHPNAIQVYDIGEHKGQYFYVMEYVTGGSLKEKLQKLGRLEESYVIKVVRQILQVLKEAENLKIIHRDIKPDNIMIAGDSTIKLADLGLAREVDDDAGLTQQKIAIGTPHYMAPEQAQGKPVDMRADQYALGVTAFHLLTGQPPFSGKNNMEVLVQHVKKNMPKPSSVYPPISPLMDKLILKMTAKEPAKRFQKIDDLLTGLDKVELQLRGHEHKPLNPKDMKVKTERVSTVYRRREKNSSAGLLILIAIIVIGGLGFLLFQNDSFSQGESSNFGKTKERILQFKDQGLYDKAISEINAELEKHSESDRTSLIVLRNQIQRLASNKQVEAILAISYDTIGSCEKAIQKLELLVSKYGENADGVAEAKLSLKKKIQEITLIEEKQSENEKERAKEERVAKLSVDVMELAKKNKFREAIEKIDNWVKDFPDTTGKVRGLSNDIVDIENEHFKILKAKFDNLFGRKEFDSASDTIADFIENGYQKDKVKLLEDLTKKCEVGKKNLQLELAKKRHRAYTSIRDDILNLLKINEPEAAAIKLSQTKNLDENDTKFFTNIISNYSSVSKEMTESLKGPMKDMVLLKKIGNKNIEVRIMHVTGGVIYYNFEGSKLELDQLAEDWAISMTDIADYIIQRKTAENLFRLSVFSYANGAYEVSNKLFKESVSKGLVQTAEIKNLYKHINDDYLDFVDVKFDEYFSGIDSAVNLSNLDRARALFNELKKKYGQTVIYNERKKEVDEYFLKIKE